jgi:hypothetical protein
MRTKIKLAAAMTALAVTMVAAAAAHADVSSLPAPGTVAAEKRNVRTNVLHGVSAIAQRDVWAVGESSTSIDWNRRTLTEHSSGGGFEIVPSPNPDVPGADAFSLQDVDGVSSNDVWAVGYASDIQSIASRTLIEHWNGSAWQVVPSPNPAGTQNPNRLFGVSAISSNDVWAVGLSGYYPRRTLILHWNGTRWRTVSNACGATLTGIDARAASDVWAVGSGYTCHYDGSSWQRIDDPGPQSNGFSLEDVSIADTDDVWAVGLAYYARGEGTVVGPLVQHWDGSRWTSDTAVPAELLRDVEALGPADVYAVGTLMADRGAQPAIIHYDGSTWSVVPSHAFNYGGELQAIDAIGATVGAERIPYWAVGHVYTSDSATRPLAERAPSRTQGAVIGHVNNSNALVSWFGSDSGTTTVDGFGAYGVGGLPAGSYTFVAAATGCDPDSAQVEVLAGVITVQDLHVSCG